jgi:hypothetical protein
MSLIQSPILENFNAMNSTLHFLHIYHLDFHLKKKKLPSNVEKILWSNKFFKVDIIFYENQDGISYTLAYFRPIHLISIEFQNIDNDLGSPPKNFFLPFNCYNLAIREVALT